MADTPADKPAQVIRRKRLAAQLGVSEVTIWRMRAELPPPVQISKGVKGWLQSDIDAWVETRKVPA